MMLATATPEAEWSFEEHEHRELLRGLNRIHDVACDIPDWIPLELATHVLGVLEWVRGSLEPHIEWEEARLYPELDARTGTAWATRSARFDHRQIRDLVVRVESDLAQLATPDAHAALPELRCHLFSLEALITAHIQREERFLIPLLLES